MYHQHIIQQHEREFMRQLARQHLLLKSIRRRLSTKNDNSIINNRIEYASSIWNDLQRIEKDINTKLGRGEIVIETSPLNYDQFISSLHKTIIKSCNS